MLGQTPIASEPVASFRVAIVLSESLALAGAAALTPAGYYAAAVSVVSLGADSGFAFVSPHENDLAFPVVAAATWVAYYLASETIGLSAHGRVYPDDRMRKVSFREHVVETEVI